MRKFLKISFSQFKCDVCDDINVYNEYNLPKRATMFSAGYDFYATRDFVIHPGEVMRIPTGVKVMMNDDEALFLYVRSSAGFKYNVRMTNQVGIIDKDYFDNPDNEGHMWLSLQNEGDEDFVVHRGSAFCQGVFMKYLITDDDIVDGVRVSGFGSTNKEG